MPIVLPQDSDAVEVAILHSIGHGGLALLVLDLDQPFVLLYEVVGDLLLAISASEVEDCVTELVLVVDLAVFLSAQEAYHVEISGLSGSK